MGLTLVTTDNDEIELDRGYDVFIERSPAVAHSDWEAVVNADPDVSFSDEDWILLASREQRFHAAVWSERPEGPYFWFQRGRVRITNADADQREKA